MKHYWGTPVLAVTIISICSAQSLRQAADSDGVLLGTAVRPVQFSESAYVSTLAREFNMVEPEDAMKWHALRPEKDTYDFRAGDEVVRFAQAYNMKVRGHCLVWGRDNAAWLTQGQFTSTQLSRLLHQHIDRVMKHYTGQVFAWDVINEALDEHGNVRDSIWYNQPGIGFSGQGTTYIEKVFRWARHADPHALLFYNEAEGEDLNRKSDAIYAMAKDFRHRGVPIDGIGLQMHLPTIEGDLASIAAGISGNIARLSALGLQVHITELDISVPVGSGGAARPEDLDRQADLYQVIVHACLENRSCTAIQTWGFTDKYSWIGSHTHGTRGNALLFDREYLPKPAYAAIQEELLKGRPALH